MTIHILDRNKQPRGPFRGREVQQMLDDGRIAPATPVCIQGTQQWVPAANVFKTNRVAPPLEPYYGVPMYPAAYDPAFAAKAAKQTTAGILALLLGWLGIHKFYLGYTNAGIAQIALTVVSCGVASIIPLAEGIIYLVKSDEEFVRTYIDAKRTWF